MRERPGTSSGLRLLMVEDQRFDAMLLQRQLASPLVGAERVDHAETLGEALVLLRERAYEAVLLDLGLPDAEGLDAVASVREEARGVAILVLTGRDELQLGMDAVSAGAEDVLVKGSVDAALLARALRNAIERQRLQARLEQTLEEHRALFENNPFPVWVYDVGTLRFLAVNEAAVREYGYSREEFLEMTLLDIRPREDAERAFEAFESAREAGLRVEEWRHRRKDGSVFDVEINAQAIVFRDRPARIVLARDITVRKRAIRALEISESRFRKLFQYSLGLICTHDANGEILSVNPAAARALGYSVGELMGRNLGELMPHPLRPFFEEYLRRILANGTDSGLLHLVAADGEPRIWQYHNILDDEAEEPYVLGHAQDITERRNYERQLREQSLHDPLTGCRNRLFLEEHAARIGEESWGCVVVDLDRFKQINDTYGHQRGDEVLVGIAKFLMLHSRAEDIVVRTGGDEFLLLLARVDEREASEIAERLLEAGQREAPSEFTIGWAVRRPGERLDAAISRADKHLYERRAARRAEA